MVSTAWVALSIQRHIGSRVLTSLLQYFNQDVTAILQADDTTLQNVPGVGPGIARTITQIDLATIEHAIKHWQTQGVQIIPLRHPRYPPSLAACTDAPPTLFYRGQLAGDLFQSTAALIGTRRPTPQARQIAFRLAKQLAARGFTIISGLAAGIDTAAHEGALHAQGRTVAVTGSGVLHIYPAQNRDLADRIMARGALISETAPDATPNAPRLVSRNRIITGLSQHVIVVETAPDGGAMHAVRFARQQDCQLYTVALSAEGNLSLLADGAIPINPDLSRLPL